MWFDNDQMLIELHQTKVRLWERSGHDLHKMAEMMKKEAKEALLKYKKTPPKPVTPNVNVSTVRN
jgi:hypothetical protein